MEIAVAETKAGRLKGSALNRIYYDLIEEREEEKLVPSYAYCPTEDPSIPLPTADPNEWMLREINLQVQQICQARTRQ